MTQSLHELAAAAAITDTSTTQISEVQGKQWAADVVKYSESLKMFDQAVEQDMSLLGKGDKTLTVPKTTSVLDVDVSPAGGEGDVRDYTEMTHFDTVDITFAESDFKRGGIVISKQIVMTSRVDLIDEARAAIAQAIAQDLDEDVATTLQGTAVDQRVYGGDATTVATLAAGDVLTPDLVADGMEPSESANFVPFVMYIAPKQLKVFRKDSQFTNAAEYGNNEVVLKGEVGKYLGIKIITTTNTPAYAASGTDTNETTNNTWAVAGHVCPVVAANRQGRKVAATYAWKEMPSIGYEYEMDQAIHKVYYDQAFKGAIIHKQAITLVKVTDA